MPCSSFSQWQCAVALPGGRKPAGWRGGSVTHLSLSFQLNPILGLVGLILIIVFLSNPARGAAEAQSTAEMMPTSYWEDVKYLAKKSVESGMLVTRRSQRPGGSAMPAPGAALTVPAVRVWQSQFRPLLAGCDGHDIRDGGPGLLDSRLSTEGTGGIAWRPALCATQLRLLRQVAGMACVALTVHFPLLALT